MKTIKNTFASFLLLLCLTSGLNDLSAQSKQYQIASEEYTRIAQDALDHIEAFEWNELFKLVSDDIEYYLPDGGPKTRTKFIGKKAFMNFWNNYLKNSGNNKMKGSDFVHIPVVAKQKLNYTNYSGPMVMSYFTLDMWYGAEQIDIRMHFAWGFDANKKISKLYTYYDRTPIIAAAKKNMLSQQSSTNMDTYILKGRYINDGVKGLLTDGGTAREKAVTSLVKSVGGVMQSPLYYSIGSDYDVTFVVSTKEEASMAAACLLARSTGLVDIVYEKVVEPSVIDQAAKITGIYKGPGQ